MCLLIRQSLVKLCCSCTKWHAIGNYTSLANKNWYYSECIGISGYHALIDDIQKNRSF